MSLFRRDERGSTLVIVLAFVSVFSLWLVSVLDFSSTGLKLSTTVETQRTILYAADAAVEANIKALQPTSGAACADPMPSFPAIDGQTVTVSCLGGTSGSGAPINVNNRPGQAILTISRSTGETGFTKAVNSTDLKIHGGVFSNSNISVSGSVDVQGNVRARTGCSGSITAVTPPAVTPPFTTNCLLGTALDPTGDDPGYPPAVATPPTVTPALPACVANGTLVVQPGTYHDAGALSALTNGTPCKGSLIWFKPGVYYFDFLNTSGGHVWNVGDPGNKGLNVVGGTPKGWTYQGASIRPTVALPGGCATENDPAPNAGVEFIFGGDSQLVVGGGNMEICAQPSTTQQQIAIYGVSSAAGGFHAPSGCITLLQVNGGCPLVSTSGNSSVLVIQGTVYTPAAALDFTMPNKAITKFFGRGVIARTLRLAIPGSQSGNTAIEVPDFSPGTVSGAPFDEVLLTATIAGQARLRARVHFEATTPPTATVQEWSVLR